MKNYKKNRLSQYVVAALTVGMFSLAPVAYALPVQDMTHANTTGTAINTATANQMGITGTAANNVMNWQTFSIASGETVQFDARNYLNLVRGISKSEINGTLTGGGNIYLINPNGILFGSTAQVNVGNLVASTRAIGSVDASGFESTGANPLATAVSTAAGDIVNLGKLQTASLVLEGNNITIQNAADITSNGSTALTGTNVVIKAAGNITVGHEVTTTTRRFKINNAASYKTVHDYANDTYAGSGYTATDLAGTTKTVKEYMLVDNVYDLQNMDAKLSGNYLLAGDIDASETKNWNAGDGFSQVGRNSDGMISSPFTGTFDGANHTIYSLHIAKSVYEYIGLFGYSTGTIKNVGLVGGSITGDDYVGGVVGGNDGGTITNVYNTGTVSGTKNAGGIVGYNYKGTITNVYNTGTVSGGTDSSSAVGGVVGNIARGTITNVYNTGAVSGTYRVSGVVGSYTSSIQINNAWYATTDAAGNAINTSNYSGIGTAKTLAEMKQAATYSSLTGKDAVSTSGNGGTTWRIYEGCTTPLLSSFFKGAATVTGLTVEYNGQEQTADKSQLSFDSASIDASHIFLADSVGRNVGTYGSLYSDQQGYDLVNTNTLTITPKTLTATLTGKTGDTYVFTKTYDGTQSATKELALGTTYTFDNAVSGDTVSIAANSSGIYANKNVGDDKTITFTGITLTGADAGNYTIADTLSGNVGQITKKNITASLNAVNGSYVFTKTYDGGKDVKQALGNNYSFATGDIESVDAGKVSLTAGTGAYTDKNAGDTKKVTFGGLVLGGDEAGNYNLTTTSLTGNVGQITKKNITASLNALSSAYVFTKTYDGGTDVKQALGNNYSFATGAVESVDAGKVNLTVGTGAYTDKNVGDTKEVIFGSLALGGDEKGNYNLTTTSLTGNVGQITAKELTITLAGNNTFTKEYDGTATVKQALAGNYTISGIVGTEKVDIDSAGVGGTYADKNAADGKPVQFTVSGLTGTDKDNYSLKSTTLTGNVGKITPKDLTATLTGDNVFTKVYDGTTAVSQALGTNYALDGIVADSDKVSLAGSGAYNDKNAGDNKTLTFSGLTLSGEGAGNYTIASTLSGAVGQITRKTITGTLASGYSFDKVYDGTTTATLGNGYTLNGVVAGDKVPLTAAKGFYDSSAVGDRTVTFSGFSINDGNYLLSMADSLSGTGKITSGSQDHNYSDALTGVSSFFGANPSDGYTIFSGSPEDYVPRAVTKNNGQSYQVGVSQVTQTWYNGPVTITIINGGSRLPQDILLGSTPDTRTVVIKGGNGYEI